ncbi:MAG: glycine cleavage system protein T [Bacteroidetes bacterium RIFCSPLOWO2_02_FULL_36_8]|nr:MAG: glycine cleavage system protein T [Bacteroidetes bacterium RIFCSPLOWO2_02_FULL_36_8]
MIDFGGWYMPVSYTSIIEEHNCVRNHVGVFDVSHMGEFILKGPHALELIQRCTSNDASVLTPGKAQYSCFPNEKGGIVDDLIVYCLEKDVYMLVVNASNTEKDWNWLCKHNTMGVEMIDISEKTTLLAVQGPDALTVLQQLTEINLSSVSYYSFIKGTLAGIDNVLIAATGYTGEPGFEIFFDKIHSEKIWNAIFETGKKFDIKPIGLGARDSLRLEMGYCLYGKDIDDDTTPLEAGLGWITKFTKEFNSSNILLNQKSLGLKKKLVGFEMIDKGIPRSHYQIFDNNKRMIGNVTSGTHSPSLLKPIGMGYVTVENSKQENEIFISVRDKLLKAKIVKFPFYKKKV